MEDHEDLAANLFDFLEGEGWVADHASDGRMALELLERESYEVVVLDLTLPRVDGLEVCRQLAQRADSPPVLMLTARDTLEDRLEGFEAGADDYLVKPFALRELSARLHALLRRRGATHAQSLRAGDIEVDFGRHQATRAGRPLQLSQTDLEILAFLVDRAPQIVRREELERRLWGDDPPDGGALRTHIYKLRQELEPSGARPILLTIRGVGYRLDVADETTSRVGLDDEK